MKRPWDGDDCGPQWIGVDATVAAIERREAARRCVDAAVASFLTDHPAPSDRRAMMDALEGKWQEMLRDRIATESAATKK